MAESLKEFQSILEKEIKKAKNVYIIGHMGPDMDSIGSAVGLEILVKHLGKKAYIIIEENEAMLESGVRQILADNQGKFTIVKKDFYLENATKDDLLILTDVNKDNMIHIGNDLDKVGKIMILDHHIKNDHTIKNAESYIAPEMSSASEMVSEILLDKEIKFPPNVANFLFAGIRLDTNSFNKAGPNTYGIADYLTKMGADHDYVNELFLVDYADFIKECALIGTGTVTKQYTRELAPLQVSYSLNRNSPAERYQKEMLAKAADELYAKKGVDASFTIGFIDENIVHISARGRNRVDVGNIMNTMGGGGSFQSAAGRFETTKVEDIFEIEKKLLNAVFEYMQKSDKIEEVIEPKVVKVKCIKRKI